MDGTEGYVRETEGEKVESHSLAFHA